LNTGDFLALRKAIVENADIVDSYFHLRLHKLINHIKTVLGITDYIIRYEAQARGSIHAHLLLRIKNGPSHVDLDNAKQVSKTSMK
jgi:hypothetical protein